MSEYRRRLMMAAGGGPTPPPPVNLSDEVQNWYYHSSGSGSVAQWDSRGFGVLRCGTAGQVTNYNIWVMDRAKTLWSTVNGKTIKVRVKTNTITDAFFGVGIYSSAGLTSLQNATSRRAGLPNLTLAEDGYYEQTFVCNFSNFVAGTLNPGAGATFGFFCYSQSTSVYTQIWDAEIYIIS